MPSRDPATGKRLNGSQQRALAEARRAADEARKAAALPESYRQIGAPPIGDTASLISWAARCLAVVCHDALLDETLPPQEKRRFVADCCAKLGLVRDKAVEQDRIRQAVKAWKGKPEGEGLTPLAGIPEPTPARRPDGSMSLAGIARPDTARRPRG